MCVFIPLTSSELNGNPDPACIVCLPAFKPQHVCRGQMTCEAGSFFPPCAALGLKSGHQVQLKSVTC